jgi:RNA recognition motif-containing protein
MHAETTAASTAGTKLYVGGLSYSMSDTALIRLFRQFGNVEAVRLIMDRMTGRSRAFGFVTFQDVTAATNAAVTLNGNEVTDTGEMASTHQTEEYLVWLKRSWTVSATDLQEYSDESDGAMRIIAILEESSRRLAQCIADYPHALQR